MEFQETRSIILFDKFKLSIPKNLTFHQDGDNGKRVLFITDSEENIIVSFDEEAQDCEENKDSRLNIGRFSFDDKSICQFRRDNASDRCAFFLIKIADKSGSPLCLIGQMVVKADYRWSGDDVEPVLKNLLECVTVNK